MKKILLVLCIFLVGIHTYAYVSFYKDEPASQKSGLSITPDLSDRFPKIPISREYIENLKQCNPYEEYSDISKDDIKLGLQFSIDGMGRNGKCFFSIEPKINHLNNDLKEIVQVPDAKNKDMLPSIQCEFTQQQLENISSMMENNTDNTEYAKVFEQYYNDGTCYIINVFADVIKNLD